MKARPRLRLATDADAEGVIALIERVFAEYPGCILEVDGEEPELKTPATSFERFWVLERSGDILGCCASTPHEPAGGERFLELKKLYLDRSLRGHGYGRLLIEQVEEHARELGIDKVELWSDIRFQTSHCVYEHLGYIRSGRSRDLHDISRTTEYHFLKRL